MPKANIAKKQQQITVTLDPLASRLVRQYAQQFVRELEDVVNGIIAGELEHALERHDGLLIHDDSLEIVHEYVLDVARARQYQRRNIF